MVDDASQVCIFDIHPYGEIMHAIRYFATVGSLESVAHPHSQKRLMAYVNEKSALRNGLRFVVPPQLSIPGGVQ